MTDWQRWHDEYDRPGSGLATRLTLVRARLRQALDARPPGPVTLISACAGQGRDVFGVVPDHPRRRDVRALLVELDGANVDAARRSATAAAGAGFTDVEVRKADAGRAASYEGAVPADIVLMCGVFGNVSDDDIHSTIAALPELCAAGAWVVWTRHREPPDLTPTMCDWFAAAGFDEVGLDGVADLSIGVGTHRFAGEPRRFDSQRRLFSFIE